MSLALNSNPPFNYSMEEDDIRADEQMANLFQKSPLLEVESFLIY